MSSPVTRAPQPRSSRRAESSASKCGRIACTFSDAAAFCSAVSREKAGLEVSVETKRAKKSDDDSAQI